MSPWILVTSAALAASLAFARLDVVPRGVVGGERGGDERAGRACRSVARPTTPRPSAPRRLSAGQSMRRSRGDGAQPHSSRACSDSTRSSPRIVDIFHTSNMSHMRKRMPLVHPAPDRAFAHPPVLIDDLADAVADAPSIGAFAEDCVCLSVGKRERRAIAGFIRPHRLAA